HGLWRYYQCYSEARNGQQATRHANLCQCVSCKRSEGFSWTADWRPCAERQGGGNACLRTASQEQYKNVATKSYLSAFSKLENDDPGAIAAFAAHVGKHREDQLASFSNLED